VWGHSCHFGTRRRSDRSGAEIPTRSGRSDVSTFRPADVLLHRAIIGIAACASAKKASWE
jgi:hypothetical protein